MAYRILVFNQRQLGTVNEETLLTAITASNYETLCAQYGLDPSLIGSARQHLRVEFAANGQVPFFLLRYQLNHLPPIAVTAWEALKDLGGQNLIDEFTDNLPGMVQDHLRQTEVIYIVELDRTQLMDMGLLLAYEIARWVAERGNGIVLGLDSVWYGLNAHMAFVPINGGY